MTSGRLFSDDSCAGSCGAAALMASRPTQREETRIPGMPTDQNVWRLSIWRPPRPGPPPPAAGNVPAADQGGQPGELAGSVQGRLVSEEDASPAPGPGPAGKDSPLGG